MAHSIEHRGGLKAHFERLGLNYDLFKLMAEANWVDPTLSRQGHYRGIRSMARILGCTDTSVIKYLVIYDNEIGRIRKHAK